MGELLGEIVSGRESWLTVAATRRDPSKAFAMLRKEPAVTVGSVGITKQATSSDTPVAKVTLPLKSIGLCGNHLQHNSFLISLLMLYALVYGINE